MSDPLLYDVQDGVATITLNRPDNMNGLNTEIKNALVEATGSAASDPAVRCVVITGTGRAFCVGQDLKEHISNIATQSNEEVWSTVPEHYNKIVTAIATMPKPVIAALNGVAAGAGASIAFASDFRIAADTAAFNMAFTGIALSCDTGSSWTLPRLVGHAKAVELLMLPRSIKADELLELGLVHQVVPADALVTATAELAAKLAAGPTIALGAVKRSLAFSATHDMAESLDFEGQMMALTGASEDHHNAVKSFVAKEPPSFTGR